MNWILPGLQKDQEGFLRVSEYLKRIAGINLPLNDKNLMLMAGRLNQVFRQRGVENYADYLRLLERNDPSLLQEFISALTTNTTEFFREPEHFLALRSLVPQILDRKRGSSPELRIWCAAASTGQEPYSIAMTLFELMQEQGPFSLRMLATDIDGEALRRAIDGTYTEGEIAGIPPLYRQKYFSQVSDRPQRQFQAAPDFRSSIQFAQFNLLAEPYPFQFPFDVVFCRNVLIYFDKPTAESVVGKLVRALSPGSYLFVGHSETGMLRMNEVKCAGNAVYQRKA